MTPEGGRRHRWASARPGWLAIAIAAALAVAACTNSNSGSDEVGEDPSEAAAREVRVSTVPGTLLALPQYVAQDEGFFEENGLVVRLVPTTSGPTALQALLSGDVDIMLNGPDFVLQANDSGRSIKFIVGNTARSITTLIARSDWPVPNKGSYPAAVRDLEGARIGVTARGSQIENQLRLMLDDAGLDPDEDVTIVATGGLDTALAAFDGDQVDAWVAFEPGTTTLLQHPGKGTALVDLRKGEGPAQLTAYPTNGYAASTSFIEENPRIVSSFAAAIGAAQRWLADPANRAELEEAVAANLQIDPSLIPRLLDDNLATFSAVIPERGMQDAIDLVKQAGLIESSPSYEDVVATEFAPRR